MAHSLTTMLASFSDGGDIASRKKRNTMWRNYFWRIYIPVGWNDYARSKKTQSIIIFQRKKSCFLHHPIWNILHLNLRKEELSIINELIPLWEESCVPRMFKEECPLYLNWHFWTNSFFPLYFQCVYSLANSIESNMMQLLNILVIHTVNLRSKFWSFHLNQKMNENIFAFLP